MYFSKKLIEIEEYGEKEQRKQNVHYFILRLSPLSENEFLYRVDELFKNEGTKWEMIFSLSCSYILRVLDS